MKEVTKLVLPVAGVGKRLLPLTKHTPKNLIRVGGRPLIEYVLDEAVAAGIKDVILVVNPRNLADFRRYLRRAARRYNGLRFHIRVQETPGGNGHAIIKAYDLLRGNAFAVRFCDDILADKEPVLASLIKIYGASKAPVVLLERVPRKLVSRFGVVGVKGVKNKELKMKNKSRWLIYKITKIVEKPRPKEAPSNLTIVGGYVLTSGVLESLKSVADTLPVIADDALPLAVALQIELLLKREVWGWVFPGRRLDCGTLDKLYEAEEFLNRHRTVFR